jgi:hypothetical protein
VVLREISSQRNGRQGDAKTFAPICHTPPGSIALVPFT